MTCKTFNLADMLPKQLRVSALAPGQVQVRAVLACAAHAAAARRSQGCMWTVLS